MPSKNLMTSEQSNSWTLLPNMCATTLLKSFWHTDNRMSTRLSSTKILLCLAEEPIKFSLAWFQLLPQLIYATGQSTLKDRWRKFLHLMGELSFIRMTIVWRIISNGGKSTVISITYTIQPSGKWLAKEKVIRKLRRSWKIRILGKKMKFFLLNLESTIIQSIRYTEEEL